MRNVAVIAQSEAQKSSDMFAKCQYLDELTGGKGCLLYTSPNTVEAEIEAKELARIIEAFLDTLTTENRVIFMRRYWLSDSCKDIAEFVGLSEKNISVRLTRIRQKMKS